MANKKGMAGDGSTNITLKGPAQKTSIVKALIFILVIVIGIFVVLPTVWPFIYTSFVKDVWEGTPGRPGLGAQFGGASNPTDIILRFFGGGASTTEKTEEVLTVRTEVKKVWETQYAAGQQSPRSTSVDFKMKQFSITPFSSINGWKANTDLTFTLEVQNEGNVPIDIETYFNCTYPRTPSDICEIAGIEYECGDPTSGVGDKMFFNDLPAGTPSTRTCPIVRLASNKECDSCNTEDIRNCYPDRQCFEGGVGQKENEPLSWCHTIVDEGGAVGGLFQAKFQAYGEADFVSRSRIGIPVINKEYATNLITSGKLTFEESKAVSTENPVGIGMEVGQIPILTDDALKTVLIAFGEPSDSGEIVDISLFTLQIPKSLVVDESNEARLPISKGWTCTDVEGKTLDDVIPSDTYKDNDRVLDLKDEYSRIREDYMICVLESPKAHERFSFNFKIPDRGVRRLTYLIGTDMVYRYRRSFSQENTITIDCTCTTYKNTFNVEECIT